MTLNDMYDMVLQVLNAGHLNECKTSQQSDNYVYDGVSPLVMSPAMLTRVLPSKLKNFNNLFGQFSFTAVLNDIGVLSSYVFYSHLFSLGPVADGS